MAPASLAPLGPAPAASALPGPGAPLDPEPHRTTIKPVFDIDEVAGALARATQDLTRPLFARICPPAGRAINALAPKPFVTAQHVERAVNVLAAGLGGIILLVGVSYAVDACWGASDNFRAHRDTAADWSRAIERGQVADVALATGVARAGMQQALAQFAHRAHWQASVQSVAAACSAVGAAAMAATLLLNPGLLGAVASYSLICERASAWAMGAAIVCMGSYALMQVGLGCDAWRGHTRLTKALAAQPAEQRDTALMEATARAKHCQLGIVVGGAALAFGLVLQVVALWPGVLTLFAGSLALEQCKAKAEEHLPTLQPDDHRILVRAGAC